MIELTDREAGELRRATTTGRLSSTGGGDERRVGKCEHQRYLHAQAEGHALTANLELPERD